MHLSIPPYIYLFTLGLKLQYRRDQQAWVQQVLHGEERQHVGQVEQHRGQVEQHVGQVEGI